MELTIHSDQMTGIEYLDFQKFDLDLTKSSIIWAPNGVGKTSIYKHLQANLGNQVTFVDCEDYKSGILKARKTITIGADIASLQEAKEKRAGLVGKFDLPGSLKQYGLSSAAKIGEVIPSRKNCKKEEISIIENYNPDTAKEFFSAVHPEDTAFYVANASTIKKATLLANEISEIKNGVIQEAMARLDSVLDDRDNSCPICGTRIDGIKEHIRKRKDSLSSTKSTLLTEYQRKHPEISLEQAVERVDSLIEASRDESKTSDDHVLAVILSRGNESRAEELDVIARDTKRISEEIKKLEAKRDSFFSALENRKDQIKDFFCTRYDVDPKNVKFLKEQGAVEVTLPRNAETYSTGEINLMVLIVGINAYIANDSKALIIDDPLSSFDLANQYVIMFELVKMVREENRPITVLTHNMNCINIADSQAIGTFQYQYLERVGKSIFLTDINVPRTSKGRRLSPEVFIRQAESSTNQATAAALPYLHEITEREGDSEESQLFHYDSAFELTGVHGTLTNQYLVDLIDQKNDQEIQPTFIDMCIEKMILFVALRVWVEKRLMEGVTEDESKNLQGKLLGEKINYIFPRGGKPSRWNGSPAVNRSFLCSKKTMMNQHAHLTAQSMPFEFALNLSRADIDAEIQEFKTKFACN